MFQSISERTFTDRQSAWLSHSVTQRIMAISQSSQRQRLERIRQADEFTGREFFLLVSACLDTPGFRESELNEMVKAFVETHCKAEQARSMNERSGGFSHWDWISQLFDRLPDQALWQLIQGAITARAEFSDEVIYSLDDAMQGQLFFEQQVQNRRARIAFACSSEHIIYMRDAAGSKNVWMDDEEFARLVQLNDSITFACFARCEQMKPHHLLYIQHKLAQDPHQSDFLATAYDAKITLMKAIERQGNTTELSWMRQALSGGSADAAVAAPGSSGSRPDPSSLWRNYLNIRSEAAAGASGQFRHPVNDLTVSTSGPNRTSAVNRHLLN